MMEKILCMQSNLGFTLTDAFNFKHAQMAVSAGESKTVLDAVTTYLKEKGRIRLRGPGIA